ncbi:hypothetical protein ROHU_015509 [Labeo rohita]|uniref:Uncharacterized protein n=1 Tax=Labeo rohita TaxID=84645 RepID=A0A498NNY2_LABRO|nr:hypothetical protein ROHU_015509 [Labeo rohita]
MKNGRCSGSPFLQPCTELPQPCRWGAVKQARSHGRARRRTARSLCYRPCARINQDNSLQALNSDLTTIHGDVSSSRGGKKERREWG